MSSEPLNFFGLEKSPFSSRTDPGGLFWSLQARETLAEVFHGIESREAFIVLTGEVGTGKTTLVYELLGGLSQQGVPAAFVFNSHVDSSQLLDLIVDDFEILSRSGEKSDSLSRLKTWLLARHREHGTPVVILDEAQGFSVQTLAAIRLLLNLERSGERLLQVVLAGQPELLEKLKLPELRQLRQRITAHCRTLPLTSEQTYGYINHRLQAAGATLESVFSSDAVKAINFYSKGTPRVINLLADRALLNAGATQVRPISASVVEDVAREFRYDDSTPHAPSAYARYAATEQWSAMHQALADVRTIPGESVDSGATVESRYPISRAMASALGSTAAYGGNASVSISPTAHEGAKLPREVSLAPEAPLICRQALSSVETIAAIAEEAPLPIAQVSSAIHAAEKSPAPSPVSLGTSVLPATIAAKPDSSGESARTSVSRPRGSISRLPSPPAKNRPARMPRPQPILFSPHLFSRWLSAKRAKFSLSVRATLSEWRRSYSSLSRWLRQPPRPSHKFPGH